MIELLSQSHELELIIKNKPFLFKYKDGALLDLLVFMEFAQEPKKVNNWLFLFLKKNHKKRFLQKFNKKLFEKIHHTQKKTILDEVLSKWSAGLWAQPEKQTKKGNGQDVEAPDSSMIMRVLESSNETVDTLLALSWRTINYMIEGLVWNLRAETEDGQKANLRDATKRKFKKDGVDVNKMLKSRLEKVKARNAKKDNLKK